MKANKGRPAGIANFFALLAVIFGIPLIVLIGWGVWELSKIVQALPHS